MLLYIYENWGRHRRRRWYVRRVEHSVAKHVAIVTVNTLYSAGTNICCRLCSVWKHWYHTHTHTGSWRSFPTFHPIYNTQCRLGSWVKCSEKRNSHIYIDSSRSQHRSMEWNEISFLRMSEDRHRLSRSLASCSSFWANVWLLCGRTMMLMTMVRTALLLLFPFLYREKTLRFCTCSVI